MTEDEFKNGTAETQPGAASTDAAEGYAENPQTVSAGTTSTGSESSADTASTNPAVGSGTEESTSGVGSVVGGELPPLKLKPMDEAIEELVEAEMNLLVVLGQFTRPVGLLDGAETFNGELESIRDAVRVAVSKLLYTLGYDNDGNLKEAA